MRHRRRQAVQIKVLTPRKLDMPVLMAAYSQVTEKWREWVGRHITVRRAEEMVAAGEATRLTRKTQDGLKLVYRETRPSRASEPTACSLTCRTMYAAARAGEHDQREELDKLRMWPFERDRRNASTVGPKIGAREVADAQATLDRSRGVSAFRPSRVEGSIQVWRAPEAAAA